MGLHQNKDILMNAIRDLSEDGYSYKNMKEMEQCFATACKMCFPSAVEKIIQTAMLDVSVIARALPRFIKQDNTHMIKSLGLAYHVYPSDMCLNKLLIDLFDNDRQDMVLLMLEGIEEQHLQVIRDHIQGFFEENTLDQFLLGIQEKSAINDAISDTDTEKKKKRM